MKKYRILYFGTWGYGAAGLKGLLKCSNIQIIKVYTKWDLQSNNEHFNKVYDLGMKFKIELFNSNKEKISKLDFEKEILSNENIDFIVSCCFDRIFTKSVLELPKVLPINVHPSLLPKYRGIKPLENAIVNGDETTGITIHILENEVDSGDILLQDSSIKINASDTYKSLYERQCILIEDSLKVFFNNPYNFIENRTIQNINEISYAPRINISFNDNDTVKDLIERYKKSNDTKN